ncbi:MAG: flagellar hook-basal body complex protein, partial [Synergistaceae bacterium]|nr:flagellar hook-basal body complex protein [Synergistaceae bacterium]
ITNDVTGGNALAVTGDNAQNILNSYTPVYQFPGSTPPKYFTVKYDESTGTMQFRSLSFMNGTTDVTGNTTTNGLVADLSTGALAGATIVPGASVFTYNLNDNMKYTSFKLEGSPTIPNSSFDGGSGPTLIGDEDFNFIVEFDERPNEATGSDTSKRSSKVTLWYYGYSNADADNTTYNGGTETEKMHKLTATAYFNPDGSFESVVWDDTNNDNAPLGFRIVDDDGTYSWGGSTNPNFRIAVGTASSASSVTNTLNFQQAKSLDNPGADWSTMGTAYQGGFHATKTTIYDDNGKTHTLEVTFKKLTENRWRWEAFLVKKNEATGEDEVENIVPEPRSGEIEFDGSGRISNAISDSSDSQRRGDGNDAFPNAEVEISIPFSLNGQPNSVVRLNFGGGVGSGGNSLLGVTQFASETTTKAVYQDGYTMGVLKNYSIASNGLVTGSYDNGVSLPIYRVALATFTNEQGLEKVGNTMFRATVNSGNANIDGAEVNGKGSIMSQYVEMSNVDLTEEFTHLII